MRTKILADKPKEFWEEQLGTHGTYASLGKALDISEQTARRRCLDVGVEVSNPYPELDKKFEELLTYRERQVLKADVLRKSWSGSYMMLVIADLHGFLVRDDMVRLAVEQATKDKPKDWPLRVVIAGDIMDLRLFSRFLDYDWLCDTKFQTKQEIKKIESLFQYLILKADRVCAVAGNHDWRAYKDLIRSMGRDKADILLTEQPILGWMMGYINGVDVAPGFYQRFGDVVVGHSEDFSIIPMRTATQFVDWLNLHEDKPYEIKVVVTGHSHHWGMIYYHAKLAIEPGCMCKEGDYLYTGRLGAGKKEKWYRGYCTIPMEDNKAKVNDIRLIGLDEL